MKVFLDTNVLVAACVEEHEHHALALPLVEAVHQGRMEGVASAHSLLETYAILTRLPRSPRITPAQAAKLVAENITRHFSVTSLSGREYDSLVTRLGEEQVMGGKAYDALHLACAAKGGAERIYTFNIRHFADLAGQTTIKIMAP